MNENPEGTPNPLNPAPADTAPVESAPAEAPAEAEVTPVATLTEEPAGTVVEPVKKKKTGLIVCLVILLLALIGGGVAAAILLLGGGGNGSGGGGGGKGSVTGAIVKLLSGKDSATKLGADGTVAVTASSDNIPFKSLDATIKAGYDAETGKSSGKISLTADFGGSSKASVDLDEIVANKTLYLKLSSKGSVETNCVDGSDKTNCGDYDDDDTDDDTDDEALELDYSLIVNSIVQQLGGQWISMTLSDVTSTVPTTTGGSETAQCIVKAMQNSSTTIDVAGLYQSNEFVTSSTDNLKITKKKNALYKLGISSEKLANFVNAFNDELGSTEAAKCFDGVEKVTADDVSNIVSVLPVTYVEVDDNNNFTRLYVSYTTDDGSLGIKADLDIDYNPTIEATAPSSSIKLEDLFKSMYQNPNTLD